MSSHSVSSNATQRNGPGATAMKHTCHPRPCHARQPTIRYTYGAQGTVTSGVAIQYVPVPAAAAGLKVQARRLLLYWYPLPAFCCWSCSCCRRRCCCRVWLPPSCPGGYDCWAAHLALLDVVKGNVPGTEMFPRPQPPCALSSSAYLCSAVCEQLVSMQFFLLNMLDNVKLRKRLARGSKLLRAKGNSAGSPAPFCYICIC